MSSKQKFEHEARLSAAVVADQLEAIAQGLRYGELTLEYDGASIAMPNASVLEFEIEAEAKGDKAELVLEIVWRPTKEPRGEPARIMSAIGVAAATTESADEQIEESEEADAPTGSDDNESVQAEASNHEPPTSSGDESRPA
ncbi:MAG: amphi-Trp domain-containing protein [Dehalococcoidia bacterium]|nr:amphi-Trp domain-containing protein [Dehalococcoidia bacterium]